MEDNKLSLSELKNEAGVNEKKAVTSDHVATTLQEKHGVVPEKEVRYDSYLHQVIAEHGQKVSDELFEQAKEVIENKKEEVIMAEQETEEAEEGINDAYFIGADIASDPVKTVKVRKEEDSVSDSSLMGGMMNEFEKEFDEEFDEENAADTFEKQKEVIRSRIKEKIKPVTDKIDLATFTISNKPISVFKAFESKMAAHSLNVADWVLYNTGIQISMIEMKGYDIESLNPRNSSRNEYNTFRDIYEKIHSNIANEDKPDLETFLKLVRFSDIPHLYFSIYLSSFNKQNVLTYTCPKKGCDNIFVEDVQVDEMYKFTSDEVEKKFNEILNNVGSEFTASEYETELMQVSDEYVVSLREPSIFNVVFETSALSESFRGKYGDIIGLLAYVDKFYYIDRETNSLVPIELKVYEKDLGKTVRYRIMQYTKILNSLSSDQYNGLTATVSKIGQSEDIKYFVPERKCPKCNTVIPEMEQSPDSLLFIRHRLGTLASI